MVVQWGLTHFIFCWAVIFFYICVVAALLSGSCVGAVPSCYSCENRNLTYNKRVKACLILIFSKNTNCESKLSQVAVVVQAFLL